MSMSLWRHPFFRSRFINPRNDELFAPFFSKEFEKFMKFPEEFMRSKFYLDEETPAAVSFQKDKFLANLDVQHFKPEEISVKISGDDTVVVEGKHEERQTDKGSIYRHFIRKFVLPRGHDLNKVESKLSPEGVLTIVAPRVGAIEEDEDGYRTIPITRTEEPAKPIENKSKDEKSK